MLRGVQPLRHGHFSSVITLVACTFRASCGSGCSAREFAARQFTQRLNWLLFCTSDAFALLCKHLKKPFCRKEYFSFLAPVRAIEEEEVGFLPWHHWAILQGPFLLCKLLWSGPQLWPCPQTDSGVGWVCSRRSSAEVPLSLVFYPSLDTDMPGSQI